MQQQTLIKIVIIIKKSPRHWDEGNKRVTKSNSQLVSDDVDDSAGDYSTGLLVVVLDLGTDKPGIVLRSVCLLLVLCLFFVFAVCSLLFRRHLWELLEPKPAKPQK